MPRRPTEQTIQRAVGARIAAARRARSMTQEALAGALSIEPATLSRYEQGRVPLTVPLLVLAARTLDVHPGMLLDVVSDGDQRSPDPGAESEILVLWRGLGVGRREAVTRLLREIQERPAAESASSATGEGS
jgi:transcriptional regulator with XRE-family HTH domain